MASAAATAPPPYTLAGEKRERLLQAARALERIEADAGVSKQDILVLRKVDRLAAGPVV
jgi:hypothetical protein